MYFNFLIPLMRTATTVLGANYKKILRYFVSFYQHVFYLVLCDTPSFEATKL